MADLADLLENTDLERVVPAPKCEDSPPEPAPLPPQIDPLVVEVVGPVEQPVPSPDEVSPLVAPFRGKGVFVTSLMRSGDVEKMRECGIEWAALQVLWQLPSRKRTPRRDPTMCTAEARRLRDAGIRTVLWGWPVPSRVARFSELLNRCADASGAEAIIVNAELSGREGPMWRQRDEGAAHKMIDGLRGSGLPLAFVSHGYASPALPWGAFSRCDVGMPEAYDRTRKYPVKNDKTFVQRCMDAYAKHYDHVIPCLGLTQTPARTMRLLHGDLGDYEREGCVWWAWTGARTNRDKRRVLSEIEY